MIRVAIDGPAGVGKSSSSKALADYFGFAYLDTGAMYRACTWWCLERGVDLDADHVDEQQVTEIVAAFFTDGHFDISVDPQHPGVFADDVDISEQIRSQEVSSHVSRLAAIMPVRNVLIAAQRAYIAAQSADDSFSHGRGVVAEGRDITDVVEPGAEVRILLTAREEVRQARRNRQEQTGGVGSDDVAKRDAADSKVTHFTEASDGVTTIDNSDIDFGETLDLMIGLVDDAIEEQAYRQYAANLDDYELDEGDEGLLDGSAFSADGESDRRKAVGVIAVVGRPNVGKSTLVNRILGRRAAVVEDTPGVTRDRVSYDAEWAGTDFKLVDTGGWEADVEGIDSAIASQAQIAVELADSVIFVVDALTGLTQTDERIVKLLRQAGKPVTVAVNKIDDQISEYMAAEFWKLGLGEPYPISAMHGRGVGDLLDEAVAQMKSAEKTSGFLTPSHLRRVALVGRPNVGKSSLLNQLSHSERSVVNELAGTTRDPVDEIVTIDGEDYLFIDTAGIKRRQHKLSGAEYYSSLRTQAAIERSELALVLFDASIPISDQDLKVMSTAVDAGRAVVLVFNKWDLMDEFDRQRMERLWKTEFDRVTWAQRVNLSAKTGWHTNRLAKAMTQALESWDQRIPTGTAQRIPRHRSKTRTRIRCVVANSPRILFATQRQSAAALRDLRYPASWSTGTDAFWSVRYVRNSDLRDHRFRSREYSREKRRK